MNRQSVIIASMTLFAMLMTTMAFAAPSPADNFRSRCASCHGPDGRGQSPIGRAMKVRDLGSPAVQGQTDAVLQRIITDGRNKMPAYRNTLAVADISSLVTYIRGLRHN